MDDSLKEVLSKHRWLLVKYMDPCRDLISQLEEGRVVPAAMIDDIKMAASKQDKNEQILQALKLRGNQAFRHFIDILVDCGQIFIADLLSEEDKCQTSFVEEEDFAQLHNLKFHLSSEEVRRLASFLDAKVKYRLLKSDWGRDSHTRYTTLQNKQEFYKSLALQNVPNNTVEPKAVKALQGEVSAKNDLLRSMSLEVNKCNHETQAFLKRHRLVAGNHVTVTVRHEERNNPPAVKSTSRFQQFEQDLDASVQRLSNLLGEGFNNPGASWTLDDLNTKTRKVEELVRDLEAKLHNTSEDRSVAVELLGEGCRGQSEGGEDKTARAAVTSHIQADQKNRKSLLMAIDKLSRKLRNIQQSEPSDVQPGLLALRQSVVTGNPRPELVDYRFLMNHLAVLEADAEHIAKKLVWKDVEVRALRSEVTHLRLRFRCRDSSPDFTPSQVELGD